jgi:predicted transcriptional regulator
MELHLRPEIEKKLNDLAERSGRPAAELAEDAIAIYADDLAHIRETLDRRYDEIKSGKVKLIPGDEVEDYFRRKYENAKLQSGS